MEEVKKEVKAEEVKKESEVVYGYTVSRHADGSIDVTPTTKDEKPTIAQGAAFDDIEEVAKTVRENKETQLVYKAAYYGTMQALHDFYSKVGQEAQAEEPEAKVEA